MSIFIPGTSARAGAFGPATWVDPNPNPPANGAAGAADPSDVDPTAGPGDPKGSSRPDDADPTAGGDPPTSTDSPARAAASIADPASALAVDDTEPADAAAGGEGGAGRGPVREGVVPHGAAITEGSAESNGTTCDAAGAKRGGPGRLWRATFAGQNPGPNRPLAEGWKGSPEVPDWGLVWWRNPIPPGGKERER